MELGSQRITGENNTSYREAELNITVLAVLMWLLKRAAECGHEEISNCLSFVEPVIFKCRKRGEYVKCDLSNIHRLWNEEVRKVE